MRTRARAPCGVSRTREAATGVWRYPAVVLTRPWPGLDHEVADGLHGVGVLGTLVGTVTEHPGEPQRHAARIPRRPLDAVEGDLHHQLRPDLDHPLVGGALVELQELVRLPDEQLVRQPLEGL